MEPTSRTFDAMVELGSSGLKRWGGLISEEFLKELTGPRGSAIYEEMRRNDAVVGGLLFAVRMAFRRAKVSLDPASEAPEDVETRDFCADCLDDMDQTWEDTLSEQTTFLDFGFAPCEILYKKREDGRIGWSGLPLRGQATVLYWDFEPDTGRVLGFTQNPPPDYRPRYIPMEKLLLFRTGVEKGNPEGCALDPDTPIPTPDGWRKMEDLFPGDKIFDETGKIRYVTGRQEWPDRPCYEMTFSDGSKIVADANHQWPTQLLHERSNRDQGKIRTTTQIFETQKNSNGVSNHSVKWASALDYPEQMLPIDPYFLGLWLGDGYSRDASIACHEDDAEEEMALINAAGYDTALRPNGVPGCRGRTIKVYGGAKWDPKGPSSILGALGLRMNKHIPAAYLRGSYSQRHALLAGLMDSDGTVDKDGRCDFTNTNKNLIDGAAELVRSLGCAAYVSVFHVASDTHQKTWRVKFTPDWTPFRLARKTAKTICKRARQQHYITSVVPVANRRTICIEVDSPNHLYLAGTAMVPTHNSILRNAYRSWFFKKEIERIEAIGIERDLAGIPVAEVPAALLSPSASTEEQTVLTAIKKLVTQIRNDEQAGVVWPVAYDENGHKLFELKLLSTGGKRNFDTSAIITRYDTRITMSVLADVILLGHGSVGSYALGETKAEMFSQALDAWLDSIAAIYNRFAFPRLLALNVMRGAPPKMRFAKVSQATLGELGAYIQALTGSMMLPTTPEIQAHLLERADLPVPQDQTQEIGKSALAKSDESTFTEAVTELRKAVRELR